MMFEGQVDSSKHINLLYDEVERHYHVIASLTGAMAKRYICKACHKSCVRTVWFRIHKGLIEMFLLG